MRVEHIRIERNTYIRIYILIFPLKKHATKIFSSNDYIWSCKQFYRSLKEYIYIYRPIYGN